MRNMVIIIIIIIISMISILEIINAKNKLCILCEKIVVRILDSGYFSSHSDWLVMFRTARDNE